MSDVTRPFLLAKLSDLHVKGHGRLLYGLVDTVGMLRACVDHLLRLKQQPDAVAITGDLTDLGQPGEYVVLRELLAPLTMPVYVIPGNHESVTRCATRLSITRIFDSRRNSFSMRSTNIRCASSLSTPSSRAKAAVSSARRESRGWIVHWRRRATGRPSC